ncbi:hypothetical protein M885DRAFT_447201 [Pelagophyceae sp. CCMP2097]|nr:hypothetical protein M885DRAFT_447201 [Pelagophyceae sp. CCMP2097]
MATQVARRAAISDMFALIERKWGNFEALFDRSLRVERCHELKHESLERLFTHQTLALVVPNFVEKTLLEPLASRLVAKAVKYRTNWQISSNRGLESSDVLVPVGTPFNVAVAKKSVDEYFDDGVPRATKMLRELSGGGASIIDVLRCDLDAAWRGGATRLRDDGGRAHHAALPRVMVGPTKWLNGYVHVDDLAPLSPFAGLFSANVYLRLPPVGGELELWPCGFWNRIQFYRNASALSDLVTLNDPDAQKRLRQRLGAATLVEPKRGDLVLLSVQRPHAVRGFQNGHRVSVQSFIHHDGPTRPLKMEA